MTTSQQPPVKRRKVNTIYLGAIGQSNDGATMSSTQNGVPNRPSTSAATNFASLHQSASENPKRDMVNTESRPADELKIVSNELKNNSFTTENSVGGEFSMDSDLFILATAKSQRLSNALENETIEVPEITEDVHILPRQVCLSTNRGRDETNIIDPSPAIRKDIFVELKMRKDCAVSSIKGSTTAPHTSGLKCGHVTGRNEQAVKCWDILIQGNITMLEANHNWTLVASDNRQLYVIKTKTGKLSRVLRFDFPASMILLHNNVCLVLLANATLSTWNLITNECIVRTSLAAAIQHSPNDVRLSHSALSDNGIPMVTLSNDECLIFSKAMNAWLNVCISLDPISKYVESLKFILRSVPNGLLSLLAKQSVATKTKASLDDAINASCEEAQLEALVSACQAIESWTELRLIFGIYVRSLLKRDKRIKLVEALEDLSNNIKSETYNGLLHSLRPIFTEYGTSYEKLRADDNNVEINLSFIA